MSRILVTGGAGFIGSHVVDVFISRVYEAVIVDDLSIKRESNLNPEANISLEDGLRKTVEYFKTSEKAF